MSKVYISTFGDLIMKWNFITFLQKLGLKAEANPWED